MATVNITVPDDIAAVLNRRAQSIGYLNAKAMTIDFLKKQYRLQVKIETEQTALDMTRATVAEPTIT